MSVREAPGHDAVEVDEAEPAPLLRKCQGRSLPFIEHDADSAHSLVDPVVANPNFTGLAQPALAQPALSPAARLAA